MNSGAVLPTVRNALPSAAPAAPDGGPTIVAVDERATRRGHRRDIVDAGQLRGVVDRGRAGRDSFGARQHDGDVRRESTAKSLRSWSPSSRAEADGGSTRSSGKPHLAPRNGTPSSNSSATTARPIGIDRRITTFVDRYQNSCSIGLGSGSGLPSMRRTSLRTSSESSRSPARTMAAGATTMAANAANPTTAMPA